MTEWIACKDRMPAKGVPVLVSDGRDIALYSWEASSWSQSEWALCGATLFECPDMQMDIPRPTHWMPLPALPK